MRIFRFLILIHSTTLLAQHVCPDTLNYRCNDEPYRIRVSKLQLNSGKNDFSPFLSGNRLFFTSARLKPGVRVEDATSNEGVTDLYQAERKDSVTFGKATQLSSRINTLHNEGPASLTHDRHSLYFSASERSKTGTGQAKRLKLYVTADDKNKWSEPVMLPFCNDGYTYCHPAINSSGDMLIFSSDRPGGMGGMDLYSVTLINGKWSEPMNLGPRVNSSANELFPFVSAAGILFFSSNRPGGFGGLDIYSINTNDSINSKTGLLDQPLNGSSDDFGIWADSTGESGYFSSNRGAPGNDDLFYFRTIVPDFSSGNTPPTKSAFCYTFFEEASAETSDTTGMAFEWDFGDGTRSRSLHSRHCYARPGNYNVQLNIVEKNSGEVFVNQVSYELTVEPPSQLLIDGRDTIPAGHELALSSLRSALKGYDLLNSYWSFGDGKFSVGKNVKHTYEKPGSYVLQLGVTARNQASKRLEKFKVEKKIIVKTHS